MLKRLYNYLISLAVKIFGVPLFSLDMLDEKKKNMTRGVALV